MATPTSIDAPDRPAGSALDVARLREDFPILGRLVHGRPLAYLDSAATSQKPRAVIDAVSLHDATCNANVHRGVHYLSEEASAAFEGVRRQVGVFLRADRTDNIVFTSGTTAGINLLAHSYGRAFLRRGDEVILTEMEHHSNIVPWQMLRDEVGVVLKIARIAADGSLDLDAFQSQLSDRTRVVAVAHVSNVLGTINPIAEIVELAHARGAVVVVDGAQAVQHFPIDLQALGCDFFVCSGHKMLGPTGVGVLYGRHALLERMPPWQGGGGMIASVTFERTTFASPPSRFEAGTPPISQVVGLGRAVAYLQRIGLEAIQSYEDDLLRYATERLSNIPRLRLLGTAPEKTGVISFVMDGIHPHDVATVLDLEGIAIRAGHHCAQPLMNRLGVPATARVSLAFYNTHEEIDRLDVGLRKVRELFG